MLGYRIELEDIEAHLRHAAHSEHVAAVAWPSENGMATGIVAFLSGSEVPVPAIRQALKSRLPAYMVPKTLHTVDSLPLNANGKVDRKAMIAMLERNAHEPH